jgi:lipopolysaccharide export system permease protein
MLPGKFNRYVLWDIIKMFLLTLVSMTLVISLMFVGQQLVAEGISFLTIIKLMPFITLIALQYSVPATLLFSVCCVYGRISADNEVIALKSAGISPMQIFRPVWVFGLLVSIPAVWLNDQAVSWARPGMQQVVVRSIEQILYPALQSHRSYTSEKGFSIHVEDVEDRWLIKPTIWMFSANGGQLTTIHAEKAKISFNLEKDVLAIELCDSIVDANRGKKLKWPGLQTVELPLLQATRNGESSTSPSNYSMNEIPRELQSQSELNARRREQLATQASFAMATGRFVSIQTPVLEHIQFQIQETERRMARLRAEPMRRWSLGFSCLAFVWMGVPMAILIRSADYWWSFGLCFIPILLVYYPLFGLALELSKKGTWPAVSLWIGNIALAAIGTWLMRKIIRA